MRDKTLDIGIEVGGFRAFKLQERIFDSIEHLESVYPGFEAWFCTKVAAGLRDGTRRVFTEVVDGRVSAVAIAKRNNQERKLCTLWVSSEARNSGYAGKLAAEAFDWLGTTTPLFTVPDLRIGDFRPLLVRWGFKHTQAVNDAYRPNSIEHVFNGVLRQDS